MTHHLTPNRKRRSWLAAGMAWPAGVWTGPLSAQTNKPLVIGWLIPGSPRQGGFPRFDEAMAGLGWQVGVQYRNEARFAGGKIDRLAELAQELAAQNPAVVIAFLSVSARAMAAAAPTTPIVLADGDPVSTGLVTHLARPGGMITGFSNVVFDLNQKVVELLLETLPKTKRVGFLIDTTSRAHDANVANVRRAATQMGFEASIANLGKPEEIEPAIARLANDKVQALVILASTWFGPHLTRISQLALARRWPVIGVESTVTKSGGLISYASNMSGRIQRVAVYVDRILKGAKPGDLPIEQPTTFDLVLNMKAARQLGITFPPSMLARATEVVQ